MRVKIETAILLGVLLTALWAVMGCSDPGANPVEFNYPTLATVQGNEGKSNRVLWGMWEARYYPHDSTLTLIPIRNLPAHFNITENLLPPTCNDCLKISVNSFNPATRVLDADVTLRNPYKISGFDVRGIFYTNDYGHEVRNADDWTGLWDIPGGQTINPFRAFAKGQINRKFSGETENTEKYLVYIPVPPHYEAIKFAVDASFPTNCKEPYEITNYSQEVIYDTQGSSGNIYVDVYDWQNDVAEVTLIAPEITGEPTTQMTNLSADTWTACLANNTGAGAGDYEARIIATSSNSGELALYDIVAISITGLTPVVTGIEPDNALQGSELDGVAVSGNNFKGPAQVRLKMAGEPDIVASNAVVVDESEINCDIDIPPSVATGFYDVEVTNDGGASGVGNQLFNVISEQPDPEDVTPPWLILDAMGICVDGGYVYIAGGNFNFHICDVSDPFNPFWVSSVEMSEAVEKVETTGGYAYVLSDLYGTATLNIIDIDPPELAYIVKKVDLQGGAYNLSISGGYCYLAASDKKFRIVDISPPSSAHIIKTLDMPDYPQDVAVSNGYAYVALWEDGVVVIDVDPPGSAHIVSTVTGSWGSQVIDISGEYAYAMENYLYMDIIDISQPESAYVLSSVDVDDVTESLDVDNGYAYMVDGMNGFRIMDIDPPETAHFVNTTDIFGTAWDVMVSGGFAYVAARDGGFSVVDIEPPDSANIVKIMYRYLVGLDVAASDGYAFIFGSSHGLQIMDSDPPESASMTNIWKPGASSHGVVSGDFVYAAGNTYLLIINIEAPETPEILKKLDIPAGVVYVASENGYVYTLGYPGEVSIVDASIPESAYIVKSVEIPEGGQGFAIDATGGYVYAIAGTFDKTMLTIIDVDPPEEAFLVNSVEVPSWSSDLDVQGGYAFVASDYYGLQIADVSNPQSPYIYKVIDTPGRVVDVKVTAGYAFVADYEGGLQVVDVNPIESAHIYTNLDMPGNAFDIGIFDNMAYVLTDLGGIRIIKLW